MNFALRSLASQQYSSIAVLFVLLATFLFALTFIHTNKKWVVTQATRKTTLRWTPVNFSFGSCLVPVRNSRSSSSDTGLRPIKGLPCSQRDLVLACHVLVTFDYSQ